ncbi:MAG: hypothetical protein IJX17_01975 [Clostridia bacterium]|nr:hypothetical protein [Clostridia bacterium]
MFNDGNYGSSQIKVTQKFNQQLRYRFSEKAQVLEVVTGIRFTKYILNLGKKYLDEINKYKSEFAVLTEKCSNVEFCIENEQICIYVQNENFNDKNISFSDLSKCPEFLNYNTGLPFAIGKDFEGNNIIADLRKLSHLLCVGFVGSSIFDVMANMILSFSSKYSPSELKFMLIEPKNYTLKKLDAFENLPHLLGSTVFKEDNEILDAFSDVIAEINRRADYLSEMGAPTIESYNNCEAVLKGKLSKMPYVVIIVNKFENVISINKSKIERFVQILTSKAKSCGFNLVIGTEKATEDVLTNIVIKHIHSKLFFKTKHVSPKYVTILPEADLLFSQGDMYLLPFGEKIPQRIQCAHINYGSCQSYVDNLISKYQRKK